MKVCWFGEMDTGTAHTVHRFSGNRPFSFRYDEMV